MDDIYVVIVVTIVGFFFLAAVLLVPVYLFLKKEADIAKNWTPEALQRKKGSLPDVDWMNPSASPSNEAKGS